jgi:poly(A) polymerase
LATLDQGAWQTLLERLQALSSDSLAVAWAALLCQDAGAREVRKLGRSFRFTNKEIDRAAWLVDQVATVEQATRLPWPQLQRTLVHAGIDDLLALASALWGADHPGLVLCRERLTLPSDQLNPEPLLSGDDLVAHGLKPAKYFGPLLELVRDAQLEAQIENRPQALALVDRWLETHPQE